jgi:hypothetical protein
MPSGIARYRTLADISGLNLKDALNLAEARFPLRRRIARCARRISAAAPLSLLPIAGFLERV